MRSCQSGCFSATCRQTGTSRSNPFWKVSRPDASTTLSVSGDTPSPVSGTALGIAATLIAVAEHPTPLLRVPVGEGDVEVEPRVELAHHRADVVVVDAVVQVLLGDLGHRCRRVPGDRQVEARAGADHHAAAHGLEVAVERQVGQPAEVRVAEVLAVDEAAGPRPEASADGLGRTSHRAGARCQGGWRLVDQDPDAHAGRVRDRGLVGAACTCSRPRRRGSATGPPPCSGWSARCRRRRRRSSAGTGPAPAHLSTCTSARTTCWPGRRRYQRLGGRPGPAGSGEGCAR